MQVMKVLCRKLRSAFLFIVAILRKVFCFWRRRRKVDDSTPYSVVVQRSPEDSDLPQWSGSRDTDQWDNWNKKPFTNVVEEKIEEYRRKKKESLEQPEVEVEPDYFNDMEPEVKQARKTFIGNSKKDQASARGSLFAFNANDISPVAPSGELGLMEEYVDNEADKWDDSIDIHDVDEVLREQRAKERRERQTQRRMEHEKRLLEKRGLVQS